MLWAISGSLLAMQYIVADQFGMILRTPDGGAMKPYLLQLIDEDAFNTATAAIQLGQNGTAADPGWDTVEDVDLSGAYIVWQLVDIVTGLYIFNLLLLFGIPIQFAIIFVMGYCVLLAITIIGYVLGR